MTDTATATTVYRVDVGPRLMRQLLTKEGIGLTYSANSVQIAIVMDEQLRDLIGKLMDAEKELLARDDEAAHVQDQAQGESSSGLGDGG